MNYKRTQQNVCVFRFISLITVYYLRLTCTQNFKCVANEGKVYFQTRQMFNYLLGANTLKLFKLRSFYSELTSIDLNQRHLF